MVWARFDDDFPEHPKVATLGELGPLAGWLHVCAICYCNRHLTDGFVPEAKVRTLASFDRLLIEESSGSAVKKKRHKVTTDELVSALVSTDMWERVPGGFQIHDYLDYQPSRAKAEEQHRQKSEAGRIGGQASAQARAKAPAQAPAKAPVRAGGSAVRKAKGRATAQAQSNPVPVPEPLIEERVEKGGSGPHYPDIVVKEGEW